MDEAMREKEPRPIESEVGNEARIEVLLKAQRAVRNTLRWCHKRAYTGGAGRMACDDVSGYPHGSRHSFTTRCTLEDIGIAECARAQLRQLEDQRFPG